MRYGIAIVSLFSVFLPAVAGESAVSVLRDKLQRRGVEVGVHGTQYVSLGDFEMEIADPVADQAFVLKRDRCSICAEILAKRALLQALGERFKPISRAIRKKLQNVNENDSLFELIASVNVVKDLQEFDALLDSKLPSHE